MKNQKVQAVIYKVENGQKKFLILHRKLRWVGWELLKETKEENETDEQALRRGIKEEIGIHEIVIEKEMKTNIVMADGARIRRAFLVRINPKAEVSIEEDIEHDDFKWVAKSEALKVLTYENAKELLKKLGYPPKRY